MRFLLLYIFFPFALFSQETEKYICYKSNAPIIIDGIDDEEIWGKAPWTDCFVDIEGDKKPKPHFPTRVKMLWDDSTFYFFAELEEPHIWATLTERESIIFVDNDFEIFIDPDDDTHNYIEFEINAFGTEWDLYMAKPYRNGAGNINGFNIAGLQTAVKIYGTINDPSDVDEKWTVEVAMPLQSLCEVKRPKKRLPVHSEIWRINYSRVQWQTDTAEGKYVKKKIEGTNRNIQEYNWVWSAQGAINMHMPEKWGYVMFSDSIANGQMELDFEVNDQELISQLWEVYYKQKRYFISNQSFDPKMKVPHNMYLDTGFKQFEIRTKSPETKITYFLNQDGLLRKVPELKH